jgi:hypothetical protein
MIKALQPEKVKLVQIVPADHLGNGSSIDFYMTE